MKSLRKVLTWLVTALICFYVLWLVIVNGAPVSLNLLFTQTAPMNAGLIVCLSFLSGLLVGILFMAALRGISAVRQRNSGN